VGEWEIFEGRIDPEEPGMSDARPDGSFARIPDEFYGGMERYLPENLVGSSTYRLKLRTAGDASLPLGIGIVINASSYDLFIDGVPIRDAKARYGGAGSIYEGYSKSVVPLPPGKADYELVLRANDASFPAGSVNFTADLGCLPEMLGFIQRNTIVSILLVIMLLLFLCNQFFLFSLQRSETQYLYFGFACAGLFLYTLALHDGYWGSSFPSFPWDGARTILTAALYAGNAFFMAYLRRLFPLDISKGFLRAYAIVSVAFGLGVVFLPEKILLSAFSLYHAHALAANVAFIIIVVRVVKARREDSITLLASLLLGIAAYGLDALNMIGIFDRTVDPVLASLVAFCLIQTLGMMRNFIRVRRRVHEIAVDNEALKERLAARMAAGTPTLTDTTTGKIEAAIVYLRENFSRDLTREDVAEAIGLHPDNFSRYFKLHTGKKYNHYLNDLRMAEAFRLLKESDRPVIDIAMSVGFNSLRTFNYVFNGATRTTPSEFRARSRETDAVR
jgi:AraC-like DNA-binding protein